MNTEVGILNKQLTELVEQTIRKTTIAGNTLELWVDCEPRSKESQSFWIDPPWRIEKAKRIIASSADFPWEQEDNESDEEYSLRFQNACEQCHCLHESRIMGIKFCAETADIEIDLYNGYKVRSFTTWREEESWHYTNRKEDKRYYVSAEKIEISDIA